MDINTPKGQETRQQEIIVIQRILNKWPGITIIETDKEKPASVDIFICNKGILKSIAEIKCRKIGYDKFQQWGHQSWLITASKITEGQAIAKFLRCSFYGFLYMMNEDKIHYWKICDEFGNLLFPIETRVTETQATVNGGRATRLNAFLDFKYSYIL